MYPSIRYTLSKNKEYVALKLKRRTTDTRSGNDPPQRYEVKKCCSSALRTIWTHVNPTRERTTIPRWDPRRRRWGRRSGNRAPLNRRSLCRTATFPPTSPRGALCREILSDRQRGTTLSRYPRLSVSRRVWIANRELEEKIRGWVEFRVVLGWNRVWVESWIEIEKLYRGSCEKRRN